MVPDSNAATPLVCARREARRFLLSDLPRGNHPYLDPDSLCACKSKKFLSENRLIFIMKVSLSWLKRKIQKAIKGQSSILSSQLAGTTTVTVVVSVLPNFWGGCVCTIYTNAIVNTLLSTFVLI